MTEDEKKLLQAKHRQEAVEPETVRKRENSAQED